MARKTNGRDRSNRAGSGRLSRRGFFRIGLGGALAARLHPLADGALYAGASSATAREALLPVRLIVNGTARSLELPARATLVDVLRETLGLRATTKACDRGWCGSCTVLVDGAPSASCSRLAVEMDGRRLQTAESLDPGGDALRRLGPRPLAMADLGIGLSPAARLYARWVRGREAAGRIVSVDVAAAASLAGVEAIRRRLVAGDRLPWAAAPVALVLARDAAAAHDAARLARVDVQPGRPRVILPRLRPAGDALAWQEITNRGGADDALAAAAVKVRSSTRLATVPRPRRSGGAELPRDLLRGVRGPVSLARDVAEERELRDTRPAAATRVSLGATREGLIEAWTSETWTLGDETATPPSLPDLLHVAHCRHRHLSLPADLPPSPPWPALDRARACLVTRAALDDLAIRLGLDSTLVLQRNLARTGALAGRLQDAIGRVTTRIAAAGPAAGSAADPGALRRGVGVGVHAWSGAIGAVAAEVEVDARTGGVRVLAVAGAHEVDPDRSGQDDGSSRRELRRGLLAGVSLALCDERILDPVTGRVLDDAPTLLEHPGAASDIRVEIDLIARGAGGTGDGPAPAADLAEAAMVAPAAAVSAAVSRALGVRVASLPLTPPRVIAALEAGGVAPGARR